MTSIIDPEEDYLTIAAAEEQMSLRAASRKKELDQAHANLKGAHHPAVPASPLSDVSKKQHLHVFLALSRILDAARSSSTRPPSIPSADKHAENLNHLDATRLSLAKAINDAESMLASKEAELTRLKEEARVLEESDPAAEHDLDGTT